MSPNDAFAQSVAAAMAYLNSVGLEFEIIDDESDEWLILGYLETNIGILRISTLIQRQSAQLITYDCRRGCGQTFVDHPGQTNLQH